MKLCVKSRVVSAGELNRLCKDGRILDSVVEVVIKDEW